MADTSFHHRPHRSIPFKIAAALAVLAPVAGILTAIMTWANIGFAETFLIDWAASFLKALFVLMPIAFALMAVFASALRAVMPKAPQLSQNIILGGFMAVVMQSMMAVVTAGTLVGFQDFDAFQAAWALGFKTSFPVGLAMALTMTTFIRPKLIAILRS